jgi:hypothetical protein
VKQEAPDELVGHQDHRAKPLPAVASVILVPEGYAPLVEAHQAAVRDDAAVANVGDAKRSKASAVDESGPYASPNFASNQRCTRAWLRTSIMLRSGSSKVAFTRRITTSSAA